MRTPTIRKRHIGLPIKFDAFDGKTYWGKLTNLRNRIASIEYQLTNDCGLVVRDCTAYVEDLKRITIA